MPDLSLISHYLFYIAKVQTTSIDSHNILSIALKPQNLDKHGNRQGEIKYYVESIQTGMQ